MLQHSRGKTGEFQDTDFNQLIEEYVNLAYHGMRAENKQFNAKFNMDLDPEIGRIRIVPQDFSRVILNIVNNACYAVHEKSTKTAGGYSPEISITTRQKAGEVEIRIKDNGTGMPQKLIDKIFNPFFTTKPTGKGTGLGLSMSYDIIKQVHKGSIKVLSTDGESTEFIISIPAKK
jgi:signal transduction histidine kinase